MTLKVPISSPLKAFKGSLLKARDGAFQVSIVLCPVSLLTTGNTRQLVAVSTDPADTSFTWVSSSPAVATVDSSGLVTALTAPGGSTIEATGNHSGKTATCLVSTKVAIITITPDISELTFGDTQQFSASSNDPRDTSFTWSVVAPALNISISASGLVTTILNPGSGNSDLNTIKATGNVSGSEALESFDVIGIGISLDPPGYRFTFVGEKKIFTATSDNPSDSFKWIITFDDPPDFNNPSWSTTTVLDLAPEGGNPQHVIGLVSGSKNEIIEVELLISTADLHNIHFAGITTQIQSQVDIFVEI